MRKNNKSNYLSILDSYNKKEKKIKFSNNNSKKKK